MNETTRKPRQNFTIEDVKVLPRFKHFGNSVDQYHKNGEQDFRIQLPEDIALDLKEKGLNIKTYEFNDGTIQYSLQLNIGYNFGGPKVFRYTSNARLELTEETIGMLDRDNIKEADVVFHASWWELPTGSTGWKCWLDEMHVTVEDSRFAQKYARYDNPVVDEEELPFV